MKIPLPLLLVACVPFGFLTGTADDAVGGTAGTAVVSKPATGTLPDGWLALPLPGKAAARFAIVPNGAIKVSSRNSVGFLYREVASDKAVTPRLTWRWRVDMTPPPSDQTMKGMDDRPLAVHVWFGTGLRSLSSGHLFDQVVGWLLGWPSPGKMLTYVWGGTGTRGDNFANPYFQRDGRIIILRPGDAPVGQWFSESVDVAVDFRKAFGYAAPRPRFIAISADTDDKRGTSMGAIAELAFRTKR